MLFPYFVAGWGLLLREPTRTLAGSGGTLPPFPPTPTQHKRSATAVFLHLQM